MDSSSNWPLLQSNVAIYGKKVGGTEQLCGVLTDYYYTTYYEVACNILANEIILVQQNAAYDLRFCGFGVLADCDCTLSSFNPLLFSTSQATPFASATSLTLKSSDSVQTITINSKMPDTISSVCGLADGVTKCGPRAITFKERSSGVIIDTWPYFAFNWNAATSELTFNPA